MELSKNFKGFGSEIRNISKLGDIANVGSTGFKNLAKSIGLSTGSLKVFAGATLAITAVSALYTWHQNQLQKIQDSVAALKNEATELTETRNATDEYINQIEELNYKLHSSILTEEESYEAKSQLYEIQQSLIETYGDQAAGIDLVNGKLDTEIEKIKKASQAEAKLFLNDLKTNKDLDIGYDKTIESMENQSLSLGLLDESLSYYENFKEALSAYGDNINLIHDPWNPGQYEIKITGNAEDAKATLEGLLIDIEDFKSILGDGAAFDLFSSNVADALNDVKGDLDTYQDLYEQIKMAELVADETVYSQGEHSYSAIELLKNYEEAINNFNDAVIRGDENIISGVEKALWEVEGILNTAVGSDGLKFIEKYKENYDELKGSIDTASRAAFEFQQIVNGNGGDDNARAIRLSIDELKTLNIDALDLYAVLDNLNLEELKMVPGTGSNVSEKFIELIKLVKEIGLISTDSAEGIHPLIAELVKCGAVTDGIVDKNEAAKASFQSLFTNTEGSASEFATSIDDYTTKITTLQDVLHKYRMGTFENADLAELLETFPELVGQTDNLDVAIRNLINSMNQDMHAEFLTQMEKLDPADAQLFTEYANAILAAGTVDSSDLFTVDLEHEIESFEALTTAIDESASATGLSMETIDALKKRYKDLDYSALFEHTAHGVRLNTEALKALEKEYIATKKAANQQDLKKLATQYEDLTNQINNCDDAQERARLYDQRQDVLNAIQDLEDQAAAYEGLTSKYNAWIRAQSSTNESDSYVSVAENLQTVEEDMSLGWWRDDERSYIDLLTYGDQSFMSASAGWARLQEIKNKYIGGTDFRLIDFFKFDEDGDITSAGLENFFHAINQKLGDEYVKYTEDGGIEFEWSSAMKDQIAQSLNVDEELIDIMVRGAHDADIKVSLETAGDNYELVRTIAEDAMYKLNQLHNGDYTIDFGTTNVEELEGYINDAIGWLNAYKEYAEQHDVDVGVLDGYEEVQEVLEVLLRQKADLEKPAYLNIDPESGEKATQDIISLNKIWKAASDIRIKTTLGTVTDEDKAAFKKTLEAELACNPEIFAQLKIDSESGYRYILNTLNGYSVDIPADISVDPYQVKEAVATAETPVVPVDPELPSGSLQTAANAEGPVDVGVNLIPKATAGITYQAEATATTSGQGGVDSLNNSLESLSDKSVTARIRVSGMSILDSLITKLRNLNDKTITITTKYVYQYGGSGGNIPVNQAKGTAYAGGTWNFPRKWRTKKSTNALVGELGGELAVDPDAGTWRILGEEGAEFTHIPKGSIVFNHKQTEDLMKFGKIKTRGRALASGTAFYSGSGAFFRPSTPSYSYNSSGSYDGNSYASSAASGEAEEFAENLDWIEVLLNRIESLISQLDVTVSSTFQNFTDRTTALHDEMELVTDEIEYQKQAYSEYMNAAESINLSEEYKEKVRNGQILLETIEDEELNELIKQYKDLIDKAYACGEAVTQLQEDLSNLYQTAFDLVVTRMDAVIAVIESQQTTLEEYINQAEAMGRIVSENYYKALIDAERETVGQLLIKRNDMQKALEDAVASGAIEEYSEAWYTMQADIDGVTAAINESTTAVIEYENALRQLDWDKFDSGINYISRLNDEAEFFVSLMEREDSFDDMGKITDAGMAKMGMFAQSYNTYMAQADMYAQEIREIEKQIAEDPYNMDLIERKNELVDAQREAILAAEDEKDAMISLVEEGIEAQLEALSELIDKYKDAMDSAKDMYDYQKKVGEQTEEIAKIEKQLAAYQGNDSEEARKTVQELRASLEEAQSNLEETQYDRYISDQKDLLDKLYSEYEQTLNARLDDVVGLIQECVGAVNGNADSISSTITSAADEVGYSLTESFADIWSGDNNVVAVYGDSFLDSMTTLIDVVTSIEADIADKYKNSNAEGIINQMQANSAAYATASAEERAGIHEQNQILADAYRTATGDDVYFNSTYGTWHHEDGSLLYGDQESIVGKIINKMRNNSNAWYGASDSERKNLAAANEQYAEYLSGVLGQKIVKGADGNWRLADGSLLYHSSYDTVSGLAYKMWSNSQAWKTADAAKRAELSQANEALASQIASITGEKVWRDANGVWYIGNDKLYDRFRFKNSGSATASTKAYHDGLKSGLVGGGTLKDNEELAVLLADEIVMTKEQWKNNVDKLTNGVSETFDGLIDEMIHNVGKMVPENAAAHISKSLDSYRRMNTAARGISANVNNKYEVNFNLPGVRTYEELMMKAQRDPRFAQMIQNMTLAELAGDSSLAKNKVKWN